MTILSEKLQFPLVLAEPTFDELFLQHYTRVHGLLVRLVGDSAEADDLTQEVFLKLYHKPPTRKHDNNVGAWLYRVAINSGYNAIRARRRRTEREALVIEESSAETDPSKAVDTQSDIDSVRAALAQLPPRQGQLLLLRQLGLSYSELAAACNIASGSVGKMLGRAANAFRLAYTLQTRGTYHD